MKVYSRTAAIAAFSLILGLSVAACGKKAPAVTPPPPPMRTLEMICKTKKGKTFGIKADRLMSMGKLEDARLQIVNACQEEPENTELAERLQILYEALALEPL